MSSLRLLRFSIVIFALLCHAQCTASFFFNRPKINGNSFFYDGEGSVFEPTKVFTPGDTYTNVTLLNWDMGGIDNLTLPLTVQTLTLNNCNLTVITDELRSLEHLVTLNIEHNGYKVLDGSFASAPTLQTLIADQNALTNFTTVFPALVTLDLSRNRFKEFPEDIYSSPLSNLNFQGNLFQLAQVTPKQFDFFAGLATFQADFVDVTTCSTGEDLVNLKGHRVCRVSATAVVSNPTNNPTDITSKEPIINPDTSEGSNEGSAAGFVVIKPSTSTLVPFALILLFCAICIVLFSVCLARRWTRQMRGLVHEETPLFFDQEKRSNIRDELAVTDKLFPSNDAVLVTWRIDYDSVKLERKLARGAFGEVWIGKYRGSKVAVKKLIETSEAFEAGEHFIREIKLMAWLQHPRILQFIGVAWTKFVDMIAVTEFMDKGDLRTLLDKSSPNSLTWKKVKLDYAQSIIDALVHLHSLSPVIIHRDLKSRNILVDSKKGAKLGDFGISATKRTAEMTGGVGTALWLAPELARGETNYNESVDIYAYGVILTELDTHQLPFHDAASSSGVGRLSQFGIITGVSSGQLRPSMSKDCPPKLANLATRCMSLNPDDRPTAVDIAYELRKRDILEKPDSL